MTRRTQTLALGVALLPMLVTIAVIQDTDPFPDHWLSAKNPHFVANLVRALGFFWGGLIQGVLGYVGWRAVVVERKMIGPDYRRRLYWYIGTISIATGLIVASTLFFVRERINDPLSPATPIVLSGFAFFTVALLLMLSYQQSKLADHQLAKSIYGVVVDLPNVDRFCVRPVGSPDTVSIDEWIGAVPEGTIVRVAIERVVRKEHHADT